MFPRLHRLLFSRNFAIFLGGQTLSSVGDAMAFVGFPLLVLEATGSVTQMGLLTATFGVGEICAGIFSGALVDALDRRKLMMACDLARAVLYGFVPVAWILHGPSIGLLFVVAGLGSAISNVFAVAFLSATADLVEVAQLTDANSRIQVAQAASFVIGPPIAGLLAGRFGTTALICIDAVSYLVSATSLVFVRMRAAPHQGSVDLRSVRSLSAGVRYLWAQPILRWLTVFFCVFSAFSAGLVDLTIYFVKHVMGRNDGVVGQVLGLSAVGAVVGAGVAPWLRRAFGFGPSFIGATIVSALLLCGLEIFPSTAAAAIAGVAFSAATMIRGVLSMSLRQHITPTALLGRVTASYWTLIAIAMPLGATATTYLAERLGAPRVMLFCGVGMILVAGLAFFTPIRERRPEDHARAV